MATIIKRNALVNYTQRQMFELVNNIEDYPRFLPWCHSSEIVSRTESEIVATLEIVWSGIHKSFTTKNTLVPYEKITIGLVKGPFHQLEGHWSFLPLGDEGCKINLELEFELAGNFIDKIFQPIFHHIANSLVDAFSKRAVEIYGKK